MTTWHSPLNYIIRNGQRTTEEALPDIVRLADEEQYNFPIAPVPGLEGVVRAAAKKEGELHSGKTPPQTRLMHHAMGILNIIAPGWSEVDHMKATPRRFADQILELTTQEDFTFTRFPAQSDEMVVLGPIPFFTLCAHHIIPFYGNAYIGYVPGDYIAGLSKFARLVQQTAKGLWVQEELTFAIAQKIHMYLETKGIAVILEGEHMCMSMRGVKTPGVVTTTSRMMGVFADHDRTAKAEFMQIIAPRRKNNG